MQFVEARARVRQMASLTTSDDASINTFINEAIVDFARDAATNPIRFTFNTVVGQTDYALSGAVVTPNGVIRFLPDEDDVAVVHSYDFTVRGLSTLVVSPAPTAVGAVTGWVIPRPAVLTLDADAIPFVAEYCRAVVYRACQIAAEWDRQDPTEITMWEGKYEGEVAKARREKARQRKPHTLKPSVQLNTTPDNGLMLRVP